MSEKQRLSRAMMALRVAQELKDGMVVNLGIGMPTLVSDYVPADGSIILHAENGVIGYGAYPPEGQGDPNLVNAGGEMVTLIPGGAFVHHADAAAIIRGGHLDITVLGGMQVSEKGDLANWTTPTRGLGSPGGAIDLAMGARSVVVMMEHTTREGEPKVVKECTYPLTGKGCVDTVVTDLGLFRVTSEGLVMVEFASGWTPEEVQALTEARLIVSPDIKEFLR